MGMPRKGSRVVTFSEGPHAGRKFRWMLAAGKGRERENDDGSLSEIRTGTVTIQEDVDRPGHVFQVDLKWLRGDSITPENIRSLIDQAITAGWDPTSRQKPKPVLGECVDFETNMRAVREVMEG